MILVNGVPKSGTHAVAALLSTMGLRRCPGTMLGCTPEQDLHIEGGVRFRSAQLLPDNVYLLGHVCTHHTWKLDGLKILTVFRDPRNVLTSYCRHRKRVDGLDVTIKQALADFWGAPFVELYRGFLPWRGRSVVVRYEDLLAAMVGDGVGIYPAADQHWNTRTGAPSNWVEDWSREDHHAWRAAGGPELAEEAGYGCTNGAA